MRLEDLTPGAVVRGIIPDAPVTIVKVAWHGSSALDAIYESTVGSKLGKEVLYRHDEARLALVEAGRPWSFDGDGADFRLAAEAYRIRLAHLFDPVLAVHTSLIDPLPHQITAVYEEMLPRQPLRFLLADDPGAGKTIMAGLLIRELITRGDLKRCLIICPGSLVEQWQDELFRKFNLRFQILTNDQLEASATGNWFVEHPLAIARLDKLARNEDVQKKIEHPEARYDLVIFDEAHKCSASYFGSEIKYTKRYLLARKISGLTRHFLLMTATPHNGKAEDFHLFLALLDGDRFEGKYRDSVHQADTSDLMRRMVKENLLKFDGRPLFPERIAYTVPYDLSDGEAHLYKEVTEYVSTQFDRAKALENEKRKGTVGFALTILQRRLASSPEAIYASLKRRHDKLESKLAELELLKRGEAVETAFAGKDLDLEDIEDLEDSPENEVEDAETEILDQTTASRTIAELRAEIATLAHLTEIAAQVRRSGEDRKWRELSFLLGEIFSPSGQNSHLAELAATAKSDLPLPATSPKQKIVVFTEHRDTLKYLERQVGTLLGRPDAVEVIHGALGREERINAQNSFLFNPDVQVLLATDAAGEGINLQRAHLMVNYDLPWNPNRLEQRFGRIHRIKQTEVCHLWNLVAKDTREGQVWQTLFRKLAESRAALGGQVFDVLGKMQFQDGEQIRPLRDLLIDAVRYGNQPEVRDRLNQVVANGFNTSHLTDLISERSLQHTLMPLSKVESIRLDMERAEARRLQPHFIESFFREAFRRLGGQMHERESRRFQISNVPGPIRSRDRQIGRGDAVQPQYERATFEKDLVSPAGQPLATFLCPGHPLLDAVLDLTLERHRELLRRGTVLVDANDHGTMPRVLFFIEHEIHDSAITPTGSRRTISKRVLYVEVDGNGTRRALQYAPYLDYRPLAETEPSIEAILARPECAWISKETEQAAVSHAITTMAKDHLLEVQTRRHDWIDRTSAAVKDRLTKEINHWDHRANELRAREQAGQPGARLNSQEACRRADSLSDRLQARLAELERERQISASAPIAMGGVVVVPVGLVRAMQGAAPTAGNPVDTQASAARARAAVMAVERALGFEPVDREYEKLGYDIESRDPRNPHSAELRFIEVKGRVEGADTITVTKHEILYSLNKPDHFILAMVEFREDGTHRVRYLRRPFLESGLTTDFNGASVDFPFGSLLNRAEEPA